MICHIFEGGSEGVIQGTYVAFGDSEYTLYVTPANSNVKFNELHIKNDSIHGFNSSLYSLHIFFEEDYELFINYESQSEGEDYPLNNWELSLEDLDVTYIVTCDFDIRQDTFR